MNKSELISIIVPMYNCGKYIRKLLESINNQTYKNIELIVIDDGSTDSSLLVVNEYLKNRSISYEVISQCNSGPSVARNIGIQNAKGNWIVFIDSDDLLHSEFILGLYQVAKQFDADCSFCGTTYFTDDCEDKSDLNLNQEFKYKRVDLEKKIIELAIAKKKIGHCNMLYRKSIIDLYNLRYPTNYKYGEDLEFLLRYLCHCNRNVIELQNKLFYQRVRSQSLTSKEGISENLEAFINNSIETKERIREYMGYFGNRYFDKYEKYIIPRVILSIIKYLALFSEDEVYVNFVKKLSARESIRILISYPSIIISANAIVFSLSPMIYKYSLKRVLLKSGVNK